MLKKIIAAIALTILVPSVGMAATSSAKIAADWAKAAKSRDGKAQYHLMCMQQKKNHYKELKAMNWVTGVSSPQVGDYKITPITKDKNNFIVKYQIMLNEKSVGVVTDKLEIKNGCIAKFNYLSPSGTSS